MFIDARTGAHYRLLGYIWGVTPALLVLINILSGAKLVELGPFDLWFFTIPGLSLAGGTVLFPATYVIDDAITETYGFVYARRIIVTSFVALAVAFVAIPFVGALPAAHFMSPEDAAKQQQSFDAALGSVPLINFASLLAVMSGRFVNSLVVAWMKTLTKGKFMALRFVVSTMAGEAVDTALFLGIAFGANTPMDVLWQMYISQYIFKVVWEIIALPVTLPAVGLIKRIEKVDHYGTQADPDEGV